jgi:hypothetical protein
MKSATKCFREMRSLTIDTPTNVDEAHLLRTGRKLSQLGETADWEETSPPLLQLGNYINSNIQSERKSIIELYSTSICLLQKADRPLASPILPPNKLHNRKRPTDNLECASPSRGCSEAGNDRDFIVSNNFPSKLIRKERNRLQAIKEQLLNKPKKESSPTRAETKTPETPTPKQSPEKPGGHISKLAIRRKLPKLNRSGREKSASDLNPWEYLQVQDEPIFISCLRR